MSQNEKKQPQVKEPDFRNFPMLERSQFFFVEQTPMKDAIMNYIHVTNMRAQMGINKPKWPAHFKLADHILFDKSKHLVYKKDLVETYGSEKIVENAKSYFTNFIKMATIQRPYHLTLIAWFVEKLVDINETAKQNKWDV